MKKLTTLTIAALLSAGIVSPAFAQSDASDCSIIENDKTRLACYDNLFARVTPIESNAPLETSQSDSSLETETSSITSEPQTPIAPPVQNAKPMSADNFGLPKKNEDEAESVSELISKVDFNARGRAIFTLENGQIWQQIRGDTRKVRLSSKKGQKKATIRRGALGSYILKIEGKKFGVKVKRLK